MATEPWPQGKVRYVVLLGRPNSGKSTFLNCLLNFHLAPVSPKPQTTRKRLLGILNGKDWQILFLDTPGVYQGKDDLDQAMQSAIRRSLRDADVVILLADPTRPPGGEEDQKVAELAAATRKPVLLVLNKMDISSREQQQITRDFYLGLLPEALVFSACANDLKTLAPIMKAAQAALPDGPFLYPADTMTDTFERQIGVELIRETLLENLQDEVPHATAVVIEKWEEPEHERRIQVVLHVERPSQKAIIIGEDGHMIKHLGRSAERKLEELCGVPVRLRLWIKVTPDWRKNRGLIQEFNQS